MLQAVEQVLGRCRATSLVVFDLRGRPRCRCPAFALVRTLQLICHSRGPLGPSILRDVHRDQPMRHDFDRLAHLVPGSEVTGRS